MKPLSSAITTLQEAPCSGTGTQRGEPGSATPESSRLASWLAERSPADVDRAAVSRASSRGVALRVEYDMRFPRDDRGNSLGVATAVKGCGIALSPSANLAGALADIERLLLPAPASAIEGWLAELSVITARRQDDEFAEELRVAAYASRLRQYPADVVKEALLRRTWKFWPSWAELEEVCRSLVAPRSAMIAAMRRGPEPAETERRERVSAERAAEIMREVWGARP